ncbi:MAG TPA: DNRLRE domain-containing protein [Candidatus Hydrogenedentes bacterium]|nr:DNRLRE domain-containing protein [Candidatus Hydrogenedentota bacterium]
MSRGSGKVVWGIIACMMLAIAAGVADAEQVALNPVKDNTIWQGTDLSSGAGPYMFVGWQQVPARIRRAFVAFDLSTIPPGSVVNSVTLKVYFSGVKVHPYAFRPVTLQRVLADWGEGASVDFNGAGLGAVAQPGDVTWNYRFFNTDSWNVLGGEYVSQVSGTIMVDVAGSYTWVSSGALINDVQYWVNHPAENFGWILRGGPETDMDLQMRLESRENTVEANRPLLTVDYSPIEPLAFTRQPVPYERVEIEKPFSFQIAVKDGLPPYSYQWYKKTNGSGPDMPVGIDSPTLEFDSVDFSDTGAYYCEASDSVSTITSTIGVLEVVGELPAINAVGAGFLFLAFILGGGIAILGLRKQKWLGS